MSKRWQEVHVRLHYSFNLLPLIVSFSLYLDLFCHESLSKQFCSLFTQVWIQSASFLLKSDSSGHLFRPEAARCWSQFRVLSQREIWLVKQHLCSDWLWSVWTDEMCASDCSEWCWLNPSLHFPINSDWPCDLYDLSLFSFLFFFFSVPSSPLSVITHERGNYAFCHFAVVQLCVSAVQALSPTPSLCPAFPVTCPAPSRAAANHAPSPLSSQDLHSFCRSSCKNRDAVLIREADNPFDRYFNRYSPITGNSSVAVRSKFIFKGVSSTMDTEKLNFIQTRRQDHWRIIHSVVEITF